MVTTCTSYIHEYSLFDGVFDCLNEAANDVAIAMGQYNIKKHQIESKMLFEASSNDPEYQSEMKKASEGVLARIGNAVMKVIGRINEFIKKITDKFTDSVKLGKSDSEKVSQMLSQHPELKDQIIEGIDKEWFTIGDVAKFEKDIIGLIQMMNKKAIDHQTFLDKVRAKCEQFTNSAKPIVDAGLTVVNAVSIFPKLHKSMKDTKEAITDIRGACEKFKDDVNKNYAENDANRAQAIFNALSQAVGLTTKEYQKSVKAHGFLSKALNKICNSPIGKVAHADDNSRETRHIKAYDKRTKKIADMATNRAVRSTAEKQRIDDAQAVIGAKGVVSDDDIKAVRDRFKSKK